mgnify:FL=1
MPFISKCKRCDIVCSDKKCHECEGGKFYLVQTEDEDLPKAGPHINFYTFDGYPMYLNYAKSPFDKPDLTDKNPRLFPIECKVTQCIWNIGNNHKDNGMGNCDRHEAWNILDVEYLEIENKEDCQWYSGRGRGRTLASIQARL